MNIAFSELLASGRRKKRARRGHGAGRTSTSSSESDSESESSADAPELPHKAPVRDKSEAPTAAQQEGMWRALEVVIDNNWIDPLTATRMQTVSSRFREITTATRNELSPFATARDTMQTFGPDPSLRLVAALVDGLEQTALQMLRWPSTVVRFDDIVLAAQMNQDTFLDGLAERTRHTTVMARRSDVVKWDLIEERIQRELENDSARARVWAHSQDEYILSESDVWLARLIVALRRNVDVQLICVLWDEIVDHKSPNYGSMPVSALLVVFAHLHANYRNAGPDDKVSALCPYATALVVGINFDTRMHSPLYRHGVVMGDWASALMWAPFAVIENFVAYVGAKYGAVASQSQLVVLANVAADVTDYRTFRYLMHRVPAIPPDIINPSLKRLARQASRLQGHTSHAIACIDFAADKGRDMLSFINLTGIRDPEVMRHVMRHALPVFLARRARTMAHSGPRTVIRSIKRHILDKYARSEPAARDAQTVGEMLRVLEAEFNAQPRDRSDDSDLFYSDGDDDDDEAIEAGDDFPPDAF